MKTTVEPGNFVDQCLAMGMVRWLQVRSVAPDGPRNRWSTIDPVNAVAAMPAHSNFPYAACEPRRGIRYPFVERAAGEWHSACHPEELACTREVVRKVLAHRRANEDSPPRLDHDRTINLPDRAHEARLSLIGHSDRAIRSRHLGRPGSRWLSGLSAFCFRCSSSRRCLGRRRLGIPRCAQHLQDDVADVRAPRCAARAAHEVGAQPDREGVAICHAVSLFKLRTIQRDGLTVFHIRYWGVPRCATAEPTASHGPAPCWNMTSERACSSRLSIRSNGIRSWFRSASSTFPTAVPSG